MEKLYRGIAIGLVILFLAAVARFYHPGTGFTALIGFPFDDEMTAEAIRRLPHYQYPAWASYDGQYYAQRALDPFLRDPATDRGIDLAPFRARRILFSWTAYGLGLGRPSQILNAYALQNVACWVVIAVLLCRWIPPVSARGLALWIACLFSHGLLWSVRFALLDGPSLMLTLIAVIAVERGLPLWSAVVVGVNGLGRETNLLVTLAQPFPQRPREWVRLSGAVVVAALPLAIWMDYLRSIYRSTTFAGTDTLVLPGAGLAASWRSALSTLAHPEALFAAAGPALILCALCLQAGFVFLRREYAAPWWRVACAYAVLLLVLDRVLANPNTGAITRVLLPLTVGFNILLAREQRPSRFWPWFVAGNLHLAAALRVMPLIPWM